MNPSDIRLVEEPRWGYRRLDPVPNNDELQRYYQSAYADDAARQGRAPELKRLLAGGPDAESERAWLRDTLFADILATVDEHMPTTVPRRALDVGAGTGEWVGELTRAGWQAAGLEPSEEMAAAAVALGREVLPLTLEEYVRTADRHPPIGMMSALNVLEHVPDPAAFCDQVHGLLATDATFVVRVPNEFNALQLAAQSALGIEPWWIAAPDHINYFDYASLGRLLEDRGFEVLTIQADFPMELFLLMGEVYLGDAEVGRRCHERRRQAELAMGPTVRRRLGTALAGAGLGRNCLVTARRR